MATELYRLTEHGKGVIDQMDGLIEEVTIDMDAAVEVTNQLRYIETGDEWDDKLDDIAAEAVNAALGITPKDIT